MSLAWALHGLLLVLCVLSIYTDITAGRVRDRFTVPALALGVILQYAIGGLDAGAHCLLRSVLGLVIAAALGFWIYNAGFIGGGTYKLVATVGAFLGFPGIFWFFAGALPPAIALLAFPDLRDRSWHLRPLHEIDLPRERWWMSIAVGVGALCAVLVAHGIGA